MEQTPVVIPAEFPKHDWLTLAAIGSVACISADMVHEALGHGIAALLTGDRILSLSTVAMQNAEANRLVSAAGTSANYLVGIIALALFARAQKLMAATYFLWIFAAFNLFNSGYLVVSALLNNGDWANVIAGLNPPWVWRCLLGATGVALYAVSIRLLARFMIRLVEKQQAGAGDIQRLVLPAYLAGGAVMTIAAIFNPISPSLILMSGVGASFGLTWGLLLLPPMIAQKSRSQTTTVEPIKRSLFWLAFGAIVSAVFIAVLGPGIHFSQ